MQDFLQLANERYSVRKYADKEIEDEKLEKILKAAHCTNYSKLSTTSCFCN